MENTKEKMTNISYGASWLNSVLADTDTDEKKLEAMSKICRQKETEAIVKRIVGPSALVFKLLFLFGLIITFWGVSTVFSNPADLSVFARLPEAVLVILSIFEDVFSLFFEMFLNILGNIVATFETLMILSSVFTGIILIFVIPVLISRIVRGITKLILTVDMETDFEKEGFNSPIEAADFTYNKLFHDNTIDIRKRYRTWICSLIASVVSVFFVLWGNDAGSKPELLIPGIIFGPPTMFLAYQIIGILPKCAARAGLKKYFVFGWKDADAFERFWAKFDPEKAAELEERRKAEEEARKRKEEELRRRTAAKLSASLSMASVTFDTRGISSANNLTVYVDNQKNCSFWGGVVKTIKIPSGHHVIWVQVYNDASESAYSLDPMEQYFESGSEYNVDYS